MALSARTAKCLAQRVYAINEAAPCLRHLWARQGLLQPWSRGVANFLSPAWLWLCHSMVPRHSPLLTRPLATLPPSSLTAMSMAKSCSRSICTSCALQSIVITQRRKESMKKHAMILFHLSRSTVSLIKQLPGNSGLKLLPQNTHSSVCALCHKDVYHSRNIVVSLKLLTSLVWVLRCHRCTWGSWAAGVPYAPMFFSNCSSIFC